MEKLSEFKDTEQQVIGWLSKMGWTFRSDKDLKQYNRQFASPIIEPVLLQNIQEINGISRESAQTVLNHFVQYLDNPNPLLGNEQFLEKLVKGVTVTIDGEDRDFYFVDFSNIRNNSFIVTNHYWVQGIKIVKTDIMLLVNGIPLVPIMAKQRPGKIPDWLEGVKEFSTYAQRAHKLFITNAFGVICNGKVAKYGIPGASSSFFSEWKSTITDTSSENPILAPGNDLCRTFKDEKDGYYHFDVERLPNGEAAERMKLGIIGLLQPARVLDIIKNFIVFERSHSKIVKKVARYQQLRAANKIVDRVVNTDLKQGIIWHTQGSGKSLTMVFTACKLRNNKELRDPTVYIVVDRKDLGEQIGRTFDDCEFPSSRSVHSIADLKRIIDTAPAGVFITTIQKFRELGKRKDQRDNIIILIDEAHRTQYGDFQTELQHVLPNARRFAFTGTPIPKTHREFGVCKEKKIREYYLDRYSIRDSVKDGSTVPIRYTFGPQEWFPDKEKLKKGWEELTADLTQDEKNLVRRKTQSWKAFLKHPERIKILAQDIAEDFRNVVEPQGYKAQVVVCDKETCVLYYDELLNYFDASEMQIIYSSSSSSYTSVKPGDEETKRKIGLYEKIREHELEDNARRRLVRNFKKRITEQEITNGNNLKILIVCNMLLTGFDVPAEQTMYLDSPLRDHNLLQAVSRTNRPYDDITTRLSKKFGRIVDYIGIFENYQEALNYDPEDIGEFEDVESLAEQFPGVLDRAFKPFEHIRLEDTRKCAAEIEKALSYTDHAKFEAEYREAVRFYESLEPHPKLRDHKEKYRWLNEIYRICIDEYGKPNFNTEVYAAKTRKLIQEGSLINYKGHLPYIKIDADYLENLKKSVLSQSDKAEKIIRDIETVIRHNESDSLVCTEFQNRLEYLVRRKNEQTEKIEKIFSDLEKLYSELDEVLTLPHRMGFQDRGAFDIFAEIKKRAGQDFDEALARGFVRDLLTNLVKKKIYIGWQEHEREIRRLRVQIEIFAAADHYQTLGIDENDELLARIMTRILQHYSLNSLN